MKQTKRDADKHNYNQEISVLYEANRNATNTCVALHMCNLSKNKSCMSVDIFCVDSFIPMHTYTLMPTVYLALLASAVSGIGHRTKKKKKSYGTIVEKNPM